MSNASVKILHNNLTSLNMFDDISDSLLIYDSTAHSVQEFVNDLKVNFSIMFHDFNITVHKAQKTLISLNDPIEIYTIIGHEILFQLKIVFPLLLISLSLFIFQSIFLCMVWYRCCSNDKK